MRVDKVVTCQSPDLRIQGMSVSLATRGGDSVRLDPIGTSQEAGTECFTFSMDISNDWLRYVRIGYNDTGVYGMELQSYTNKLGKLGMDINDASLKKNGFGLRVDENGRPDSKIMGFKGSYTTESPAQLNSLGVIIMDITCANENPEPDTTPVVDDRADGNANPDGETDGEVSEGGGSMMWIIIIVIVVLVVLILALLIFCFKCGPCKNRGKDTVTPLTQTEPSNSQPRSTPELVDAKTKGGKGLMQDGATVSPRAHQDSNINLHTVPHDEDEFTDTRKHDDIEKRLKQKK